MGSVIIDGFVHQLPDIDPEETQEWLDSLDAVVDAHGKTRARFLISKLLERAPRAAGRHAGDGVDAVRQHDPARARSRGSRATSTSSAASAPTSGGTRR